jgi:hypothetical protein
MCVITDAPAQLLAGEETLPRYEDSLSLFPAWLSFLLKLGTVRSIASFAVQYWFYAQIDALDREGKPELAMTVISASRKVMALQKQLINDR